MNAVEPAQETVLHDTHISLGARMAPFAGFDMPIQYEGILKEHEAARKRAVIFDTCHMGEYRAKGASVAAELEKIVTCGVSDMAIGQCRYGLMCNGRGGVEDDLLLYRLAADEFMIVVNAGTRYSDFEWIGSMLSDETVLENLVPGMAKLDLQGPESPARLKRIVEKPLTGMRYYHFALNSYRGRRVLISRTGYTGEIGFEIYTDEETAVEFWNDCLELGVEPAGLGARDTLRLEMGMPLYGHELSADRNAGESGFTRAIRVSGGFKGDDVVLDGKQRKSQLVGLEFNGRRAARNGDPVSGPDGTTIGAITSGSFAPSLDRAVALAYVRKDMAAPGTRLTAVTARGGIEGTVSPLPFYKGGTARRPIEDLLGG